MHRFLLLAALLFARPAPAEAPPVPTVVPAGHFVEWNGGDRRFVSDGATVTVSPRACAGLGEEQCPDNYVTPHVTTSAAGLPDQSFDSETTYPKYFPLRVVVGRFDARSNQRALLWDQYTGGAHCCHHLWAWSAGETGWVKTDLGTWDMDDLKAFPRDLSGDGRADLVIPDGSFLYAFASYAESVGPPRVFNLVAGRLIDVSRRAAFRPLFSRQMVEARRLCLRPGTGSPNGACAAYAADAARLGVLPRVWPQVIHAYSRFYARQWGWPTGCRIAASPCPDTQKLAYPDYPAALRAFLIRAGYLKS